MDTILEKMAYLRKCIDNNLSIDVGYEDRNGYISRRTLTPKEVEFNQYNSPIVRAHDSRSGDDNRSFNIERIKIIRPEFNVDESSEENSNKKTDDEYKQEVAKIYQKSDISPNDHNTELLKDAVKSSENRRQTFTSESTNEKQHFKKDETIDHDFVSQRLKELRNKLLEFNKRNALINSRHSERSYNFIRVIDELPNVLYKKIKDDEMYFKALPDTDEEPEDEKSNEFQSQLNSLRQNDEEYLENISELGNSSEDITKLEILERALRDKLREKLGMQPIKRGKDFDIRNHAKIHDYNPDYNLPLADENANLEYSDNFIQTLTLQKDLDRRMSKILKLYNEKIQTMGVNALKVSFGFIEWYETDDSDESLHCPLLMMPIKLERKKVSSKDTFAISSENEDAEINNTIFEYFNAIFKLKLPEFEEDELPESYFNKVRDFLKENKPKWRLKRWMTVAIYPFQTMASLEDLKEENWEEEHHLTGHDYLAKLLAGKNSEITENLGESHDIDDLTINQNAPLPSIVLNADASQYSAVIDAMVGKNLVIQGPPGTGKSQTIANIIAAAVNENKSVLFVAEKLPALKVVENRLREVKLGALLLDLTKSTNMSLLGSVEEAIEQKNHLKKRHDSEKEALENNIIEKIKNLKKYKKLLYETKILDDLNATKLLWRYIKLYNNLGKTNIKLSFENLPQTFAQINEDSETLQELENSSYFSKEVKQIKSDSKINFLKISLTTFGFENFQELTNEIKDNCLNIEEKIKTFCQRVKKFSNTDTNVNYFEQSFTNIKKIFGSIEEITFKKSTFFNKENLSLLSKSTSKECNDFLKKQNDFKEYIDEFKSFNVDIQKATKGQSQTNIKEKIEIVEKTGLIASMFSNKLAGVDNYLHINDLLKNKEGKERKKDNKLTILKSLLEFIKIKDDINSYKNLAKILGKKFKKEKTSKSDVDLLKSEIEILYKVFNQLNDFFKSLSIKIDSNSIYKIILSSSFNDEYNEILKLAKSIEKLILDIDENLENFNENHIDKKYDFWFDKITKNPQPYTEVKKKINLSIALDRITNLIGEISGNVEDFKNQISLSTAIKKIKDTAIEEFINFLKENHDIAEEYKNKSELYEYLVIMSYLRKFDSKYSTDIEKLNSNFMNKNRFDLRVFDDELNKLQRDLILAKGLSSTIPSGVGTGPKRDWTEFNLLKNELSKKKGHISARNLLRRANNALKALKPVWLVPALKVSDYLQRRREQFDILIIDEASQLPPERAITSIVRSKQVIIVGDDKQLPPTTFFNASIYNDYSEDEEFSNEIESESILDLAKSRVADERTLRWHYRSRHQSLIEFSNFKFYDNKLLVFPSPYSNDNDQKLGMDVHTIPGNYKAGINESEAKEVIEKAKLFMNNFKEESLSIVTMNKRQMDYIHEEFERLRGTDEVVKDYFDRRKNDDSLEPFTIMNLENFQGMERDNIIVSTVYGKEDGTGTLRQNFGPINGTYGPRRLNVLFTRARNRLLIVSSMKPSEIKIDDRKDVEGKVVLRGFLEYAATKKIEQGEVNELTADSDFEIMVAKQLENNGFKATPQVGVAGFRIDIGVTHENYKYGFLAGIECDGAMYHSSYSARCNDRIRQDVLEGLGWKIYRVWSTDWFNDSTKETEKMIGWLHKKLEETNRIVSFKTNKPPETSVFDDEDEEFIDENESKPKGNRREHKGDDEVLKGYYFEAGPGVWEVWDIDEKEQLGKIEKENLNLAQTNSTYGLDQARRNLPKYLALNSNMNTKEFNDIFLALDWIYAS